jgi:thiol-disulfide isomerase/thioredoxin
MKRPIAALGLFIALSITLSSVSSCTGDQRSSVNNANINGIAAEPVASPASSVDPTVYPQLPYGLAYADFELLDGTKFKVSDKKGKVVLLNIWGTWCGPCRAEMPTLVALQNKYKDKGLEIIGLNIGDGEGLPETNDQITKFVEQMQLNYTIARSTNANTREFYKVTKAEVVPQSLLVDREGRLRGVFIGGGGRIFASLEDTIGKIMAE